MDAEQAMSLRPRLEKLADTWRGCFRREVTFGYFVTYTLGLLAEPPRKRGEPTPGGRIGGGNAGAEPAGVPLALQVG